MEPLILRIGEMDASTIVRDTARALKGGGIAVIPTDTVYGVAAHPAYPPAVERLYGAKRRPEDKPIPLLAADTHAVEEFGAQLCSNAWRLAAQFWPGALTLVLDVGGHTEGFRVPDCELTRQILAEVGGVLRVSSANLSGMGPALAVDEAIDALGDSVDVYVDAGPSQGGVVSSVVGFDEGRLHVFREGAVSEQEMHNVLGDLDGDWE